MPRELLAPLKTLIEKMKANGMQLADYDYTLPPELIAQDPLEKRDESRLMILDKKSGDVTHRHFYDVKDYLKKGDCLVINNTKVIPARLLGHKEETGGAVEVLLLKRKSDDLWETLVRPGKKCRPCARLSFGDGRLRAEVMEVLGDGNRLIRFFYEGIFEEVLDALGEMPLPPYITHTLADKNRYQTVYAKYDGSAAAPTAGLHFTKALLEEVKAMGVSVAEVTLHVGLGTFRPVKEENILDHQMHSEHYEISKEACDLINATKAGGGRVIAVGTTSTRTLEAAAGGRAHKGFPAMAEPQTHTIDGRDHTLSPRTGDTEIFIYPGYEFCVIDGLITNFHLPKSTLLMLVSAFAGRERVLAAYDEAVKERYRFFSFGDAMLLI